MEINDYYSKRFLQKDLYLNSSNRLVCHRQNAPFSNLKLHVVVANIPRGCRYCHGKQKKKKKQPW